MNIFSKLLCFVMGHKRMRRMKSDANPLANEMLDSVL